MADNEKLKAANAQLKDAKLDLAAASRNYAAETRLVTSELSQLRSSFTDFSRAQQELNSAIKKLNSPILSSIASFGTNLAVINEQIRLKKQEIDIGQRTLAAKQRELSASEAVTKAAKEAEKLAAAAAAAQFKPAIDNAGAAVRDARREEQANKDLITKLQEEVKVREERLKNARQGLSNNPFLATDEAAFAKIQEELTKEQKKETELAKLTAKRKEEHAEVLKQQTDAYKDATKAVNAATEVEERLRKERDLAAQLQNEKNEELKRLEVQRVQQALNDISETLDVFAKTIRDTQNKLGISSENSLNVVMGNAVSSFKSFFDATTVSTEQIIAQQEAFQEQFGGVLTSDAAKGLAQQAKELGVTGAQLASARRVFMTSTMGDLGQAKTQQEQFLTTFRQQGLTNKDAMNAIAQYSELYARNGSRFADSFARAAVEAKKIGVDLGKIDQVGDNIIGDFEGFLEKTAELGAMGFNLDSSRLGEVAESGDTGALMTELRSQLAATGKDLTNLRRSEQLALSNAFGIPMAELQRLAAPTAGSGEQLTEQEQTNSILTTIAEKLGVIIGIIGGLMGMFANSLVQTGLLSRIAGALSTGGVKDMVGGLGDKVKNFFGKGTGEGIAEGASTAVESVASSADAVPQGLDAAEGVGSKVSGLSSKINATDLIKGAAALVLMAGALYIMGKALQEFKTVSADDLGVAIGAITALTLALFALGALFVGPQSLWIFAGIAALGLMAGVVFLLGKALKSVGDSAEGIAALGTSFDSLSTAMSKFNDIELNKDNVKKIRELAAPNMSKGINNRAQATENMVTAVSTREATPAVAAPPTVDFSKLEAKLDQVVRAISSMEVKLDATKVGEVIVNNEKRVASNGIFSLPRIT